MSGAPIEGHAELIEELRAVISARPPCPVDTCPLRQRIEYLEQRVVEARDDRTRAIEHAERSASEAMEALSLTLERLGEKFDSMAKEMTARLNQHGERLAIVETQLGSTMAAGGKAGGIAGGITAAIVGAALVVLKLAGALP